MEFDNQMTPEDFHVASGESIGALLKRRREERGLTLEAVAGSTRVPKRHLAAIEADAHESLPALPYTIGFVRSFARAVGMSEDAAVAQFRAETTKTVHVPQHTPLEPLDEKRVPPRGLVAVSIGAVALFIVGVTAYGTGWLGGNDAPDPAAVDATLPEATNNSGAGFDVPPGTAQQQAAASDDISQAAPPAAPPADIAAASDTTAPSPAATASPVPGEPIVISATEDAWLKVYDRTTRKAVKMGILKAGESYRVEGDPTQLLLWTGKAGALQISVGGRTLPPLGGPVETVRDISLSPADLLSRAG